MFKANTGFSLSDDARLAGREAAAQAKRGLTDIKAVFVYFSNTHDPAVLLAGLKEEMPGIPIIGCSSCYGVILPEGFISGHHFIAILAIEDEELKVGIGAVQYDPDFPGHSEESDEFDLGNFKFDDAPQTAARHAALTAMKKAGRQDPPLFFYMVSPPGMEERYINGLASVIGRVPFAGSTAGDASLCSNWIVLSEEGPMYEGVVAAFFYGGKVPLTHYTSPYRETGDYGIATKVINNRCLAEIDGRPALELIADNRGWPIHLMRGADLSLVTPMLPLGVKSLSGNLVSICHLEYGNKDGSIFTGSPVFEGMALMRMECTVDDLVHGCGAELEAFKKRLPGPAGAFHLAINYSWKIAAAERFSELVDNIRAAAGDVPFICPLTNGEHGFREDSGNTCGGLMMSYICFQA